VAQNQVVTLVPGGVDELSTGCPPEGQRHLLALTEVLQQVASDAVETVSHFGIPGFSYQGYDDNGMFARVRYRKPKVCLHVRPPVLEHHSHELEGYTATHAIVSFRVDQDLPRAFVARLVDASIAEMKARP